MREKSNTKICTRNNNKKTALLRVKLETFDPSRLHNRSWMRRYDTCTGVSTVSVVSVSLVCLASCQNSPQEWQSESQVKCHQRPFWSISVFFGVVGKNPSMEDLPTSSFHTTVDHKTLKILLRGVNLGWRVATNQWSHWRAWSGSIYNPFFIFGQGQSRTPY